MQPHWFRFFPLTLVSVSFLIFGIFTISDYGINWDEPMHFSRGQAYLHYFLTKEKNFLSLPAYPKLNGASDFRDIRGEDNILYRQAVQNSSIPDTNIRRSYYESDVFTFEYFINNDSGHPPLNGILAAFFNYIFYQKLNLLGDIESYHLFEIFVSSLLVLGVGIFTYKTLGTFSSLIASLSLSMYPLFFGESHFNIKDPVEASFFGITIILFYFGFIKKSFKLILFSSVFFGLSLGTKFNALFVPLILGIWLIFYFIFKKFSFRKNLVFTASLIIFPLMTGAIFYISWPYLWKSPITNTFSILSYYKTEGFGSRDEMTRFLVGGWNSYPVLWIIYTTPLPIILLSILGFLKSLKLIYTKKDAFSFLILTWFFIPILRVSLPNTVIYGGVRQIMEYIPAMAILAGIGANEIYKFTMSFKSRYRLFVKFFFLTFIFVSFLSIFLSLVKLHPNENVYFNSLIGGLAGAKSKNIPSWGNSYGNAYYQAILWINQHAEKNAKLGLPIGNMANIPRIKLRKDILFSNDFFSGFARQGEYQIELSYDYPPKNLFNYSYLDKFLEPIYEVKVDGVAIAKVWKNDLAYTRKGFEGEISYSPISVTKGVNSAMIDLGKNINLTRLLIQHNKKDCINSKGGYIAISRDKSIWFQLPDPVEYPQMQGSRLGIESDVFFFLFADKVARYISINTNIENSCMLNDPEITVFGLKSS